jgi:hypothetical protein
MNRIGIGVATVVSAVLASASVLAGARSAGPTRPAAPASLAGTWVLSAADDLRPDGTRVQAYGSNPRGLLFLGDDGRYALQIFRSDRPRFTSGDKRRGTPQEYEAAVLGMSTHFGRYVVDATGGTITFQIELASFPNWEGTEQKRPYTLSGDELSYRVTATPDGTVPISVWRRAR